MTALLWTSRLLFGAVWAVLAVGVYFAWTGAQSVLANPPLICTQAINASPWSLPPPVVWASLGAFGLGAFLGHARQGFHKHAPRDPQPDVRTRAVLVLLTLAAPSSALATRLTSGARHRSNWLTWRSSASGEIASSGHFSI